MLNRYRCPHVMSYNTAQQVALLFCSDIGEDVPLLPGSNSTRPDGYMESCRCRCTTAQRVRCRSALREGTAGSTMEQTSEYNRAGYSVGHEATGSSLGSQVSMQHSRYVGDGQRGSN